MWVRGQFQNVSSHTFVHQCKWVCCIFQFKCGVLLSWFWFCCTCSYTSRNMNCVQWLLKWQKSLQIDLPCISSFTKQWSQRGWKEGGAHGLAHVHPSPVKPPYQPRYSTCSFRFNPSSRIQLLFQVQSVRQSAPEDCSPSRHPTFLRQLRSPDKHNSQQGQCILDQAESWHGASGRQLAGDAWSLKLHGKTGAQWALSTSRWLDESR